ncbi:MAG: signal peptide peptidase SppA [Candidatus Dadabacteria bacterium]|nr:signal peptide peptidase SppA [Candidatus Dadabacteria bacterium]NIS09965.1 signal peptide peptidase SppA [Candidatus Dadabacteria bacterium]NIV42959.1 signal peptide peptidase SppA [Candidatus Dadabacteria bacterium]NIY22940.1 signal peptide peptidase SppA [Candidatus Dadabacteria bacterium]
MRLYESFITKLFSFNLIEIELEGDIPEESESIPIPFIQIKTKPTVWQIEKTLTHITQNNYIRCVVLKIKDLHIGLARANAIRTKIQEVRMSGVKVLTYLEGSGNAEYLIASASDKIVIAPWSALNLIGLKAEIVFLKDAFEKYDIEPHFKSVGEFKSAVETFTSSKMSKAHKEMLDSLLGDLFKQLATSISQGRNKTLAGIEKIIDSGPYLPDEALKNGLIDAIGYDHDFDSEVEKLLDHQIKKIEIEKYIKLLHFKDRIRSLISIFKKDAFNIGILTDTGMITQGESQGRGRSKNIGHNTTIKALREVYKSDKIKALVYRVSSPGGSGLSSDLICSELENLSEKIPVVVSMSDVAASGGYLIALGGNKIVTDPFTLTGSIGVFGGKINVANFLKRFGINIESVQKGEHALMFSPTKGFSETESKKIVAMMKDLYDKFISRVSSARKLTKIKTESNAKGRVWTGSQAKELKLIDEFGGIYDSVKIAASLANLDMSKVIVKTVKKPKILDLSTLGKSFGFASVYDDYIDKLNMLSNEDAKTLMPFILKIK